jgi:alpha-ketoglutarate-dependent taurine dioxygenase
MSMRSEPIKPHLGEIVHIERSDILDEAVAKRCLELLDERGVLVFPKLGLTGDEQIAFTERLGPSVNYSRRVPGGSPGAKDIYKVTLDPEINDRPEYVLGTYFWHIDGMTSDIPPPKATLLTAQRLAPRGGQTEFASTYAAYKYLPEAMKAEIAGLKARHSLSASVRSVFDYENREDRERQDRRSLIKDHPLVWRQSAGRKSLIIGETTDRIVDMPLADGRALLARLLEWTAQPDFVYRHEWQAGDLVMWNNCGNLHRVVPYDKDSGRMMYRTTLAGTEDTAAVH